MTTIEILKILIAFPTISADSNMKLVDYCSDQLIKVGAEVKIIKNNNGTKANLFATVGPLNIPSGFMFFIVVSYFCHTDTNNIAQI